MTTEDELKTLKARHDHLIRDGMRRLVFMDDLAESMALGIEAHLKHHVKEVPELRGPLAQWRKIRPTPGFIE